MLLAALRGLAAGEARAEGVVAVLGDSLTAGLGVGADEAFPARLQARLRAEGYDYRVVNAGVSGDTTAGGLRRVDWVLRAKPDVVIVALGANDGLRGLSPQAMSTNLEAIVRRLQAAGARVLLAGMRMPPNYGDAYTKEFEAVFPEVARRTKVPLMPFLLDGDLVVVRRQKSAARGQIAVVRTSDGQSTVKHWFPERGRIRLQPANKRMQPIYVREAEVVGVVVSVVRRLE